jgi:hypothetical protein
VQNGSPVGVTEQLASEPPAPPLRRWESDVALSVFLVLLLATTLMAWPLRDAGAGRLLTALRVLALVAGVVAVARDRLRGAAAVLAALAVAWAQAVSGERAPLLLATRLVFFAVVASSLLARVFGPGRVTLHRLLGAVAVYVLLAVGWGTGYELLTVLRPGAIVRGDGPATLDEAMWMSFVTLTTTGYGDVLPVSGLARSLAALEAMVGVLYPAILISRLVSLAQGPAAGDSGEG